MGNLGANALDYSSAQLCAPCAIETSELIYFDCFARGPAFRSCGRVGVNVRTVQWMIGSHFSDSIAARNKCARVWSRESDARRCAVVLPIRFCAFRPLTLSPLRSPLSRTLREGWKTQKRTRRPSLSSRLISSRRLEPISPSSIIDAQSTHELQRKKTVLCLYRTELSGTVHLHAQTRTHFRSCCRF